MSAGDGGGGDEEDDYMSDAFLGQNTTAADVRPGLLMTHNQRRLHDQMKRKRERELRDKSNNPKALEEQGRREGLDRVIDSDNKGYALLQKMGYKPGSGIGKNNSGRVEPVGIVLKTDRKGLGRETALKEIRELKKSIIRSRLSTGPSVNEYRERRAQEAAEKLDCSDLYRCQRVCRQMDLEQNVQEPYEKYFWPNAPEDEITVEDEEQEEHTEESMSINEQLQIINLYLRHTYHYCVYCGTVYDDENDLNGECPGPSRQDH